MSTEHADGQVEYTVFTDGDDEVQPFLNTLGVTTDPDAWRSKKLERSRFEELYTCLQKDYNGGMFLFGAQIFHQCIVQTSGNHIFFRGDRNKVKLARSFLEDDGDRNFVSSHSHILASIPPQVTR